MIKLELPPLHALTAVVLAILLVWPRGPPEHQRSKEEPPKQDSPYQGYVTAKWYEMREYKRYLWLQPYPSCNLEAVDPPTLICNEAYHNLNATHPRRERMLVDLIDDNGLGRKGAVIK